ncbi:spliceosome ATPase-activating subunit SPP2 SKDI_15G2950 [Saccharomyces kudriavzevii IFO 1802]|uniref:Pre-mRNA-splicing factor n=2 Tax=Saccharomyces kudriavzevii (strain ATCC MYA-4449 / AS 2.2408 / CBS 8840 / NBRC 1802 / NCYC 2889) TaxID=226230 RepID=J5PQX5_SACK1|nr:uncharacterized protein SKDI_15G2950 [Saccharomyces kudriavzevii IFO 1802]EJT43498.1 SPP2-like protein [Saccharomyces kudriavzevii IFO 1802]CAI4051689.1 hypothetical protein SKDI_15G2950 [Saccharomyces kudriavzevii IFO 1802]
MNKISLKLGNKNLKKNVSKKSKKKNSSQKGNLFSLDGTEVISPPHRSQDKIRIQSIDKFDLDGESFSKKKLVIKLTESTNAQNTATSSEEYVTEKEYSEVPIEEFGDALLRGMGWESDLEEDAKRGKEQSEMKDISNVSRIHPDGLGIGAKLNKDINVERSSFMPVAKIDKLTGTKVSEEKKEEAESR